MIAGGAEASVMPLAVAGFSLMCALTVRNDEPKKASRPFDKNRDGFVIGGLSACVILEEERHALKRGAKIYCELLGYGMSGDAYHLSHPAPEGRCSKGNAGGLNDARLNPEQIQYINADGTSTPLNHKFETMAIHTVFKKHESALVVNSTKSLVGHLSGAAGALEFAVVAKSIAMEKSMEQ